MEREPLSECKTAEVPDLRGWRVRLLTLSPKGTGKLPEVPNGPERGDN